MYAGKQINEKWAIIPICAFHHAVDQHQDGKGLDKHQNMRIALLRASEEDLAKYPRVDWLQRKLWLGLI